MDHAEHHETDERIGIHVDRIASAWLVRRSSDPEVVHDIDLKEQKFGRPETPGVAAAIIGLCLIVPSDDEGIERGAILFESLLSSYATHEESESTKLPRS